MKKIVIKRELCTACLNCNVACMVGHSKDDNTVYNIDLENIENESRNRITIDANGNPTPVFCRHCDEPECVLTCMSGAMTKDKKTGVVLYDEKKCGACFMCIMSCGYGVLKADNKEKKVVIKCDRCTDRETPRCIESCQMQAIYLEEVDEI